MTNSAITLSSSTIQASTGLAEFIAAVLHTVAPSSRRVYLQTFNKWAAWAASNGIDAADLRPAVVLEFLRDQNVTKATQQRQMAAFRKLAQMMLTLRGTDVDQRIYNALKLAKADGMNADGERGGHERRGRALAARDMLAVFGAWRDNTDAAARNAALIAVLALSGIRRAEAAALKWADVNLDAGTFTVRHGKGDKQRVIAFIGDAAIDALRRLYSRQAAVGQFTHVFTAVNRAGAFKPDDKPITGTDVYRIVQATERLTGIAFKPHDLRRTFVTDALTHGTPLATVQKQAGHANPQTTLRYAQAVDAAAARVQIKLSYS